MERSAGRQCAAAPDPHADAVAGVALFAAAGDATRLALVGKLSAGAHVSRSPE